MIAHDIMEELLADIPTLRYPKPRPRKVGTADASLTLVAGDLHFPEDDPRVTSILFQVAQDAKPGKVILGGDLPDMLAISRFPKDMRGGWTLEAERKAMADFLWTLHDELPGDVPILELDANHSGGGIESRWWRHLSNQIGELATMPNVIEALDYRRVWHPEWSRVEMRDHETITQGLIAIHGDLARGQAGSSAMAMLQKWRVNLIMGHCHRMGSTGYRVPAIGGQKSHQMRAYENGCCCKLDAPYIKAANWQQGFSLVRHDDDGTFGVEQILVHEGKAVSTTTGKVYRS